MKVFFTTTHKERSVDGGVAIKKVLHVRTFFFGKKTVPQLRGITNNEAAELKKYLRHEFDSMQLDIDDYLVETKAIFEDTDKTKVDTNMIRLGKCTFRLIFVALNNL